ncbi:hypothetical protein QNH46_13635 [Paenibacillus woosongensis]|uniref:Uncharacterized protein n=1 Tax=Paenibacillus woosongensis TaxID=307580 RepID=A0AA95I7M4_9BACL|nr:hypothetical protein [Paenibacillus woosongensis]WHX47210.1 hypothetical protein QNH46_13635 [Paenibacillus woosongensis]
MKHLDETMIAMLQRQQAQQTQENAAAGKMWQDFAEVKLDQPFVQVGRETLSFQRYALFEDQLSLVMPSMFKPMTPQMAALKYPSERRPQLIYTNALSTINVAFNHTATPVRDKEIGEFTQGITQILRRTQKILKWYGDGVVQSPEAAVGYCEFVTPVMNGSIYNFMFFLSLEGRALMCTFNCLDQEMNDWRPVAKSIMASLRMTDKDAPSDLRESGQGGAEE